MSLEAVLVPPPQPAAAQPVEHVESKTSECWWELLTSLRQANAGQAKPSTEPGQVVGLLSRAWTEAQQDGQWNASGIPELLRKALEMAKRGSTLAAIKYAADLLDFHQAALKYRATARSAGSPATDSGGDQKKGSQEGGSVSSASTSSDVTSTQAPLPPLTCPAANTAAAEELTRANSGSLSPVSATSLSSGPVQQQVAASDGAAGVFSVPEPPAKRRRTTGQSSVLQSSEAAAQDDALKADPDIPTQEWSGALGLVSEDGTRVSDLCHATLQLPTQLAQHMPRALQFTHLVQRRGVMLGAYQVVRTSIKKANMRQMSRLRSMAQHELVAVASLEHLHIIVVPYQDNKGQLKLVSFALSC